jgi:hypothetical protein
MLKNGKFFGNFLKKSSEKILLKIFGKILLEIF